MCLGSENESFLLLNLYKCMEGGDQGPPRAVELTIMMNHIQRMSLSIHKLNIISFSGLTPICSIFSRNIFRRILWISHPWMKAGPAEMRRRELGCWNHVSHLNCSRTVTIRIVPLLKRKKREIVKEWKVGRCYDRAMCLRRAVIPHVPALMYHTAPVRPVPLRKMTDRLRQIYRHHKSQQPCSGHCPLALEGA